MRYNTLAGSRQEVKTPKQNKTNQNWETGDKLIVSFNGIFQALSGMIISIPTPPLYLPYRSILYSSEWAVQIAVLIEKILYNLMGKNKLENFHKMNYHDTLLIEHTVLTESDTRMYLKNL